MINYLIMSDPFNHNTHRFVVCYINIFIAGAFLWCPWYEENQQEKKYIQVHIKHVLEYSIYKNIEHYVDLS